jgi:6-phosphogluconolactonase (cycloisomerase 2 family)
MSTPSINTGGGDPRYLTVDPLGKYLYVSNFHGVNPYITACTYGCGFVSQFTIGADGSLTSMPTPTFFTSGPGPGGSAVHPTKPWYYVAQGWSSVSQNIINADGSLTSMATPTVAAGTYPDAIAIDPLGKWAYVVNGDAKTVSQYSIDSTSGMLAPLTPPTVAAFGNAFEIKTVSITSGEYAYVTNYFDATVSQYKIDSTSGVLSQLTPSMVSVGGTYALSIAVDPQGRFAYVPINTSQSSVIAQFKINADGTLVSNGTVSAGGAGAASIAFESSGKYAYATSGDTGWGSTSIAQYTIDQTTGALSLMSNPSVLAGFGPSEIVTVKK